MDAETWHLTPATGLLYTGTILLGTLKSPILADWFFDLFSVYRYWSELYFLTNCKFQCSCYPVVLRSNIVIKHSILQALLENELTPRWCTAGFFLWGEYSSMSTSFTNVDLSQLSALHHSTKSFEGIIPLLGNFGTFSPP